MISFVVPGIARPQGSMKTIPHSKTGQPITLADNPGTGAWRVDVGWAARAAGCRTVDGPVVVVVRAFLPRPRGHYHRGVLRSTAPTAPIVKPDGDKLMRAVLDALTGVAFRDDAQVVLQALEKLYCAEGQPPEARIQVGPWMPTPIVTLDFRGDHQP